MPHQGTGTTNALPLRDARDVILRTATVVRYGLFAWGLAVGFQRIAPLVSDAQFTWGERRIAGIVSLTALGGFALAGWAAGSILRAAAALLGAVADATDAAVRAGDLIERQLMPTVARAAFALERLKTEPESDPSAEAIVEIRRAIGEARWSRADRLLSDFASDRPHAPERATLAEQLDKARRAEAVDVGRRLDEALAADDVEESLACRDVLTRHLRGSALRDLDLRVARRLTAWVRERVRRGEFTPRLAEAAFDGAERFGDSEEGKALRAAVPDLRRRAGLCIDCARPYRGDADVCPACSGSRGSS
jgi:hypothetical protein